MASEIRVDKINSLSGVGTVTLSPTGVDIAGITTAATLRATTGIVTSLTAGSLTSLGAVSGTTGTFSAAVSGTTGTFTGDVDIADKIVHTGDTDTAIRFSAADTIQLETGGTARFTVGGGNVVQQSGTLYVKNATGDSNGLKLSQESGDESRIFNHYSGALTFGTANTERARISSTGQLSVNTTADVTGVNVAIGGSMRFVNATGQSATISALPSGTYNTGHSGGSAIVFHRFSDGGGGSDEIAFETHHQGNRHGEAARFNKSGNLVFPSGQGIDFSATSDGSGTDTSELFDDYEEGTWTPSIRNDGNTPNWTGVNGRYVKIGQQVTVWFNVDGGTTPRSGSSGSSLIMTGMPYSISMFGNPILGIVGVNQHSGDVGVILNVFGQGGTQVRFGLGGKTYTEAINYSSGCFTYPAAT